VTAVPAGGGDAASSPAPPDTVRVGRLGRTHGLHGSLRLHLDHPDPALADALRHVTHLHVLDHGRVRVRSLQPHGRTLLVAFQGVRSPERAQTLVNAAVYLEAAALPSDVAARLAEPSLENAEVFVDGRPFGRVVEVIEGPQTLLLVRCPVGDRLVPATASYVHATPDRVDISAPPPGLLDDEATADVSPGRAADGEG
jgi:16S rRNA processing protein RimM